MTTSLQERASNLFSTINLNQPGAASSGQLRTMIDAKVQEQMQKGLDLPTNYSSSNALTVALLRLGDIKNRNNVPALQCCTPSSIIQSLMNMTVQGLTPAKDQCYFIVYGNQLQMQRSYFGTVASLKRLDIIKDVQAQVVHEGDEFAIDSDENFQTVVSKFKPNADCLDKPIKYAFAVVITSDNKRHFTIMTKKEIDASWSQAKTNKVQLKFGQEMAKRTILNRAAKMYINTSDDSDLLADAINDTTANEYDDEDNSRRDVTPVEENSDDQTQMILDSFDKAEKEKEATKSTKSKKRKETPEVIEEVKEDDDSDSKEETNEENITDGQTELFSNGTIKPKADEADA